MDDLAVPGVRVRAARGPTSAVVLVLYGGRADSIAPSRPWHLSALRLAPFARHLHRRLAAVGVATWTLRYRVRGWNGDDASPVADARWALAEIRRRHGDVPVVLVGHSMGGRTALRVADDPAVVGVVALAPWLPPAEPRVALGARRLLVVHGTSDRWTDPVASKTYVQRAAAEGTPATWVPMDGHGHFMLRERGRWRRLTTSFVTQCLTHRLTDRLTSGPAQGPRGTDAGQAEAPPASNPSHHV